MIVLRASCLFPMAEEPVRLLAESAEGAATCFRSLALKSL